MTEAFIILVAWVVIFIIAAIGFGVFASISKDKED